MKSEIIAVIKNKLVLTILSLMLLFIELNAQDNPDFINAILKGDLKKVESMLNNGVNANSTYNRETALIHCAKVNSSWSTSLSILKLLLKHGADMNAMAIVGGTALTISITSGNIGFVKALIENGVDVNYRHQYHTPAIFYAVSSIHRNEILKILLENGANANDRNSDSMTPLMLTAMTNNLEGCKILLAHGADVNTQREKKLGGEAPLFYAVQSGYFDIVKLLCENGANVKIKKTDGTSPIHSTVHNMTPEIIKYLKEKGADINAKDNDGNTALIRAAFYNKMEHVRMLIELGANINVKSKYGATALGDAKKNNNEEMINLLKKSGAK
ncbi:MAG: ankyrin repeat domain-containing protein [Melioribacteraceae bacterium]|nr:ankyrin repeat domain-containing protein [Melioribacteraceae bacterium]